jgi:peroxiredoxin
MERDVWRLIAVLAGALVAVQTGTGAEAANRAEALAALRMTAPASPEPARDFTLPRLGGGTVRLGEFRGKVVLLNFWATWCPPCIAEMPGMQAVQHVFGEQGFVVLAVNLREPQEEVRAFVDALELSFPVAFDHKAEIAGVYGVLGLPTTVLIDRRGLVVGRAVGGRDWTVNAALHLFTDLLREPALPTAAPPDAR